MLQAARAALPSRGPRPRLIAVTVLTSMAEPDLAQVGVTGVTLADQVMRLAGLAAAAGLDGVVCSASEAAMLRRQFGADFLLVTPGIRAPDQAADDQRRTATPAQAVRDGSSYLVIGRPITQAPDPLQALAAIESDLAGITA